MKPILKKIDGILLLDKSLSVTSNGALQRVKRLFNAKKAGHTGSLDPLATGMLPICFGEATKVSQFLLDSNKCYQVTVTLGIKTTTGDAEGEVIQTRPVQVTKADILCVMEQFKGDIQQVPPMYSAIKYQGKPLYELARKGIEIERQARSVSIYRLELTDYQTTTFSFTVYCSKGTYIRTLAEDIGERLGTGGHVSSLRRLAVTPYEPYPMYTIDKLEEIQKISGHEGLLNCLLPLDTSVQHLSLVKLSTSAVFYLRTGQPVRVPNLPTAGCVRLITADGQFVGIGEILEDGRVAPKRLVGAA